MTGQGTGALWGGRTAFTLLELLTVMVIISILLAMVLSVHSALKAKAERAKCTTNLTSLYAAASSYLTDNQSWPQISTVDIEGDEYAKSWVSAFEPYHLSRINWVCPTIELALNPSRDGSVKRIDYIAAPFDSRPSEPHRFRTQPWFIERASVHGDGNLLIYSNGEVHSLNDAKKDRGL